MGLAPTLVNVTPNEIVYLLQNTPDGEGVYGTSTIISSDGFTSQTTRDLVVDCDDTTWGRAVCARLRQVCYAGLNGLGAVAAGGWTQALARDLLIGNGTSQAGGPLMPRAELDLQPVAGAPLVAEADANVDVSGYPTIVVTSAAVSGSCILRVRLRATPGVR